MGVAVATTRSPGLASTALLIVAIVVVVAWCNDGSVFARAFPAYLALAAAIVVFRVGFYILVGIKDGGTVLIPLPQIPLPDWAGGIGLLGPVSASGLQAALTAGLALGALLICFGAAVALTDPQRTLRSLPASLHLLGTSAIVAMTLAPQLVSSWKRVRRAQSLRGRPLTGARAVAATTLPVLQSALEGSLSLAASMDSRGYARVHRGSSRLVLGLMLGALLGAALGTYALLDGSSPGWLAIPLLILGAGAAMVGSVIASRRILSTRFRPDRWGARENLIAGGGVATAALALFWPHVGAGVVAGLSITFLACALLAMAPLLVAGSR